MYEIYVGALTLITVVALGSATLMIVRTRQAARLARARVLDDLTQD